MSQEVPNLSQSERMEEVLRLLETRDSVHVTELSEVFAVSEVTVRNDLSELARQGLVARVRGGVRPLQRGQSELGFDLRLRLESDRKQAIARAAAAMVEEGEAVALDSSTTAYYLAHELRSKRELVIGILDGTKWHRSALLSFCPADGVDAIVTDSGAPVDEIEAWRSSGVEVVAAEVVAHRRTAVRARDLRRVPPSEEGAA